MPSRGPIRISAIALSLLSLPLLAQSLRIEQVNVGWGNCTYVSAPNGKTVLMDAGDTGMGADQVKPYLVSVGAPTDIDVVIGSHMHCDHVGGLAEVIGAGYTAGIQYSNGSSYASSCVTGWEGTTPTPVRMPVNTVIDLGESCRLICVGNWDEAAGNYEVCDGTRVSGVSSENDKSLAILISCGGFQYLWTGDLGGGNTDASCTGRSTSQADVETALIDGMVSMGYLPVGGVDVLSVGHHGSESSTGANLKAAAGPEYALCATGRGQSSGWALPRKIVLDDVLLGGASCVAPPAVLSVFQSEEGDGADANGDRSYSGYCVGDIVVTFDLSTGYYCIDANGAVDSGTSEYAASGLPICAPSDAGTGCTPPAVPASPAVTDPDTCVQDGVRVAWEAVPGATGYDLLIGSTTTLTDVTSPHAFNPGDTASRSYQIRSKNGATCASAWSAETAGADTQGVGCGTCAAPATEVIETVNADNSGFRWANIPGAQYYKVVRGVRSNLSALLTSSADFSCYLTGIADGAAGVDITADDPSADPDRCYYYLIQGYDCSDPDAYLGSPGDATDGERILNLSGNCQPCAAVSASIGSVSPSAAVVLGTEQTFDGSGSGEGSLTYEWDLHYDGATFDQEAVGAAVTYTYTAPGSYTAALRVTDSCTQPVPQVAYATQSVTVSEAGCGPRVVISQVYGGGGNTGSTYRNDFVELHNAGDTAQDLTGWGVQYGSSGGSSWQVTALSGSVQPGAYYLVREAAGSGGTTDLPTPDATGTLAMGATAGKVALTTTTTTLSGPCPTGGALVDFVGYGSANCYEGTGPTPAPSNTNAVLRAGGGCTDTGQNASDFSTGAPSPRNSATAPTACACP